MRTLNRSGFRVWSREDIEGVLTAIDVASQGAVAMTDSYESRLYRQGFTSALHSLAQMFGIDYTPDVHIPQTPVFHTIESSATARA